MIYISLVKAHFEKLQFFGKFSNALHTAFNHGSLIIDPVHLSWPGWIGISFQRIRQSELLSCLFQHLE